MLSFRCSLLVEPALTDIFPLANAALHVVISFLHPLHPNAAPFFFLFAFCSSRPLLLVYYFLPFWLNAEGRGLGNTPTADARVEGRRRGKKKERKNPERCTPAAAVTDKLYLVIFICKCVHVFIFSAPHHEIIGRKMNLSGWFNFSNSLRLFASSLRNDISTGLD